MVYKQYLKLNTMELKTFIEKYSTMCANDENFSVDIIAQLIEDYIEITLPKETIETAKVSYGIAVFQGFFVSALLDNNCGVSSDFDKFIIGNCEEIIAKYEERHPSVGKLSE